MSRECRRATFQVIKRRHRGAGEGLELTLPTHSAMPAAAHRHKLARLGDMCYTHVVNAGRDHAKPAFLGVAVPLEERPAVP